MQAGAVIVVFAGLKRRKRLACRYESDCQS
jgi:hypothetical protein